MEEIIIPTMLIVGFFIFIGESISTSITKSKDERLQKELDQEASIKKVKELSDSKILSIFPYLKDEIETSQLRDFAQSDYELTLWLERLRYLKNNETYFSVSGGAIFEPVDNQRYVEGRIPAKEWSRIVDNWKIDKLKEVEAAVNNYLNSVDNKYIKDNQCALRGIGAAIALRKLDSTTIMYGVDMNTNRDLKLYPDNPRVVTLHEMSKKLDVDVELLRAGQSVYGQVC